ncbi:MAG: type II secretion system protein E [Desulfurococcales archaeon ex4484_217_1]|nr:MAG: type II secretion system protein E [Desulfurococcales archaeon ex4484_217_1]
MIIQIPNYKPEFKKLLEYNVGEAVVSIIEHKGKGYYIVQEPKLEGEALEVFNTLMDYLYRSLKPLYMETEPVGYIEGILEEAAEELGIKDKYEKFYDILHYYIIRDIVGYGKIDVPMKDPRVEELAVEGPGIPVAIVHRDISEYPWLDTNIRFNGEEELRAFVQKLALRSGKHVSTAYPILEARLPEGHRIALTLSKEISGRGSSFVIRKFPEQPLTITHLLALNTLSPLEAAYLWLIIEAQGLIFIIGAMASGKTTLLQSLTTLIPPDSRVITVEDTPELRLPHEHWDPLYTRRSYSLTEKWINIDLHTLVKFAWRRRAEYIIVGEVRGEEVQVLVQASASGHGGLTTLHADTVDSMMIRLMSPPLNVKHSFLSLIWSIAVMKRLRDIRTHKIIRRLTNIYELKIEGNLVKPVEIFSWDPKLDKHKPEKPQDVYEKSFRLKMLAERYGLSDDEMFEELKTRKEFLEKLVREDVFDYDSVALKLFEFYSAKRHGG